MVTATDNINTYRQEIITQITNIPLDELNVGYKMIRSLRVLAEANKVIGEYDNTTATANIEAYQQIIEDQIAAIDPAEVLTSNKIPNLIELLTLVNCVISDTPGGGGSLD